jgi:hypothetical protein
MIMDTLVYTSNTPWNRSSSQPTPAGIHHLDVVMILGPVISYEQQASPVSGPEHGQQPE